MDEKYDLSFNEYFKDKDLTNSMAPLTGSAPRRPRRGRRNQVKQRIVKRLNRNGRAVIFIKNQSISVNIVRKSFLTNLQKWR